MSIPEVKTGCEPGTSACKPSYLTIGRRRLLKCGHQIAILTWNQHIDSITANANRVLGLAKRTSRDLKILLVISRCCFADDVKDIDKNEKRHVRACKAIVFAL